MNLSPVAGELRRLPDVHVECTQEPDRLLVQAAGRTVTVRVVARASGYPRDVRTAVWQAQTGSGAEEILLV